MTMRALVTFPIIALAVSIATSPIGHAEPKREIEVAWSAMEAAFRCSTYAIDAQIGDNEHNRLFELGVRSARKVETLGQTEDDKFFAFYFQMFKPFGLGSDFMLGTLYQQSVDEARKETMPSVGQRRKPIARKKYEEANCALLK